MEAEDEGHPSNQPTQLTLMMRKRTGGWDQDFTLQVVATSLRGLEFIQTSDVGISGEEARIVAPVSPVDVLSMIATGRLCVHVHQVADPIYSARIARTELLIYPAPADQNRVPGSRLVENTKDGRWMLTRS